MAKSTTTRSLKLLRDRGWLVDITEHFNVFTKRRKDLFTVLDLVALKDEILGVQTTSGSHVANRVSKIVASKEARAWLTAGGKIVVHGWAKRGPRGKRKVWTCVERFVTLDDFA